MQNNILKSYGFWFRNWCERSKRASYHIFRGVSCVALAGILALAAPKQSYAPVDKNKVSELQCLSNAVYYEARGENLKGKRAVVDVIAHRVLKERKTICEVVKARRQFAWYGKVPFLKYGNELQEILRDTLKHPKVLKDENYRWFYSGKSTPVWAFKMECHYIGNHRFCRERKKIGNGKR